MRQNTNDASKEIRKAAIDRRTSTRMQELQMADARREPHEGDEKTGIEVCDTGQTAWKVKKKKERGKVGVHVNHCMPFRNYTLHVCETISKKCEI